ncbi:galectin-5-like isoform X2 [Toxorhynchites rutilus septentrionalis]|uniref:galectin-5-like isoform X2 n=1 Tax=Toxorhynchites rutilus septentrionalis TaxID=329112 RepID=UPI0024791C7F|nr:galectin-5-like isoform X2 [Toxorhynchites rutilus septentrionalis]
MATIPIISPKAPFLGSIPGGLSSGSVVRVKCVLNNFGDRCQINLQTGAALNPRDDVLLHISIRPQEGAIVRNTLQNQIWGTEERYGGCPITYGQSFVVSMQLEWDRFKIAINGEHFCTFGNRFPNRQVQFVSVDGNCTIDYITMERGTTITHGSPVVISNPGMIAVCPPYIPPQPYHPSGSVLYPPAPPPPPPPYTPSAHYPGRKRRTVFMKLF